MRDAIKLGLFLLVICATVGLGAAYANGVTDPIITKTEKQAQEEGLKEIYPQADTIKDVTNEYFNSTEEIAIKQINVAYEDGQEVGVIYSVESKGYSSTLKTLVGFDIEQKQITNKKVLSQAETPGLGTQIAEDWYAERYQGKSAEKDLVIVKQEPKKDNEVEAITAATISSKAVTQGINEARKHFQDNF